MIIATDIAYVSLHNGAEFFAVVLKSDEDISEDTFVCVMPLAMNRDLKYPFSRKDYIMMPLDSIAMVIPVDEATADELQESWKQHGLDKERLSAILAEVFELMDITVNKEIKETRVLH